MTVRFDGFVLDVSGRRVVRDDTEVRLTPKAFELLHLLVRHRLAAVSKTAILEALWPGTFVLEANVANLVAEIRSALGDDSARQRLIRTVARYGYAFTAKVAESEPSTVDVAPAGLVGPIRLVVPTPKGVKSVGQPAVAPNGDFVVFRGVSASSAQLYLQRFDEALPRALSRTEGAVLPFVSPDGRWIGFLRAGRLERIAVEGGEPLTILEGPLNSAGAVWLPCGSIVFGKVFLGGLSAVSAEGGEVRTLTTPDASRGELAHIFPSALPDGRHVLFTACLRAFALNDAETALLDVESGQYRILFKGSEARFAAPGAIVFFRAGAYHAIRFDARSVSVAGEPVRILADAAGNVPEGAPPQTDISHNGTLVYLSSPSVPDSRLVWVSPDGCVEDLPFRARAFKDFALAPDGCHLAAGVLDAGRYVIRLFDLRRWTDDPLNLPGSNWRPVWHPDGRRLAFNSMRKGDFDVYWKDMSSTAPATPLLVTDQDETPTAFLPDGGTLFVTRSQPDGTYALERMVLSSPVETTALVSLGTFASANVAIRHDGRFLAFVANHTGAEAVYVLPLMGDATPERVSTQRGVAPAWSPDGRELYYLRPPGEIMAVTFREEGGRLRAAAERPWARLDDSGQPIFALAVGPDGRMLMALSKEPVTPQICVVLGWDREIGQQLGQE